MARPSASKYRLKIAVWEGRYGYGGIRVYQEYRPNIGGFLLWAGSGAMVAYMLQGNGRKKDIDVSQENEAGD
jgi:hypothetical protein